MAAPEGPPFAFSYRMSESEYSKFVYKLAAMFYKNRKSGSKALNLVVWLVVWLAVALVTAVIVDYTNQSGDQFAFAALLPIVSFFAGAVFINWFLLWSQRKAIAGLVKGLPAILDVTAEVAHSTLKWQSGSYGFTTPLSGISQIADLDGGLLVRAGLNGVFLPSHAFSSEQQKRALHQHLAAHLTPEAAAISVKGI